MSEAKRKHFINGIQVDEEVVQSILNKPTYFPNKTENLELYNDFVQLQKEPFKAIMYYFNDMITELKNKGKISSYMEFRVRIKSTASAFKNDEQNNVILRNDPDEINNFKLRNGIDKDAELKNKVLDDVFGMEFIGGNEDEVNFILSIISKKTVVARKRDHKKDNGYKAKHRVFALNDETAQEIAEKFNINPLYFPLFEAQFKTIEIESKAPHESYKKDYNPKDIQKKYDNDEFKIGYDIPQMWVSKDGQMKLLSPDEAAKKLYPFLDITKKIEQDRNQ